MKMVALREAKQSLSGYVAHAQRERVLITKHGRPAALVIGVQGQDVETVLLGQDPSFWKLIEKRRKQPTVSLRDVKAALGVDTSRTRRKRADLLAERSSV